MFLETITVVGNDVLVPLNRIKFIYCTCDNIGYKIHIVGDDGDWIECFEDVDKQDKRYTEIKNALKVYKELYWSLP